MGLRSWIVSIVTAEAIACGGAGSAQDSGASSGHEGSSGSSGGPEGEEVVMDDDEGCMGIATPLADLAEVTSIGFSAQDIVDRAGEHAQTLTWLPASGPWQYELPEAPSMVHVAITVGAEARYVESLQCDGTQSCALTCLSRVELVGETIVSSDDGLLDETIVAPVSITKSGRVFVQQDFEPETAVGDIRDIEFALDDEWMLVEFELQTEIEPDATIRGRFLATLVDPDGLLWFNTIGVWPSPP